MCKQNNEKIKRDGFFIIFGIFILGLFLRLVYIFQYQSSPFFTSPVIDALSHYLYAVRMASGDWMVRGVVAGRAPLYVYFLAVLFKIFGIGYMASRIVQVALGALNCILVFYLARKVFNRQVGLIAAFICSVYGVFIYFDAEFLNVALTIFINLLLLLSLLKSLERPRFWKWVGSGILFGLALQTSANVGLFLPFIFLWLYLFKGANPTGKFIVWIFLIFLGIILIVLPFAIRNYFQGGDFVLISSTAGINLYIGNNPQADGKSAFAPTRDFSYAGWQDNILISSVKEAERLEGRALKPSEISRFWILKTLEFIITQPGKFIQLLARKFYYFFNGYEIPENQSIYFFRIWSGLLKLLVFTKRFLYFPFGIICPLALVGLAVAFKKEKGVILISFFILAHLILMLIFFVCSRYRAPVVPYFIIFASYAVFWFYNLIKEKKLKILFLSFIPFTCLYFFCNSNFYNVRFDDNSHWFLNLGVAFRYKGRAEQALKSFAYAKKLNAKNPDILYNIGVLYLEKEQYQKAIAEFQEVIKFDPRDSAARSNLGLAYFKQGKLEEAIEEFKIASEIDPEDAGTAVNLGAVYLTQGDLDKAQEILGQAQKIKPNFAPLHNQQGVLYEKLNKFDLAKQSYLLAIKINPDYFEAHYNLALLYERLGLKDKAKEERLKALGLLPRQLEKK